MPFLEGHAFSESGLHGVGRTFRIRRCGGERPAGNACAGILESAAGWIVEAVVNEPGRAKIGLAEIACERVCLQRNGLGFPLGPQAQGVALGEKLFSQMAPFQTNGSLEHVHFGVSVLRDLHAETGSEVGDGVFAEMHDQFVGSLAGLSGDPAL